MEYFEEAAVDDGSVDNDVLVVRAVSSTRSNSLIGGGDLTDDATSKAPHQKDSLPKAHSVGYIFKSDLKIPQEEQKIGPCDSTAESGLSTSKRADALKKVMYEIRALGLDDWTYFEAFSILANDDEQLECFLDLPPGSAKCWVKLNVPKTKRNLVLQAQTPVTLLLKKRRTKY